MNVFTTDISDALDLIEQQKAGFIPPFLTRDELDELLQAWHKMARLPDVRWEAQRFITDERLYEEPAFTRLATHPIVQEAARRVIGDFQLASYAVVATPPNATTVSNRHNTALHTDHKVYSDVPVPLSRDTFVCIWINFEDLAMENGPFALAVGTHALNIGDEYFADAPDRRAVMAEMGWDELTEFNIGPAGSTAVYSGKTWHAGTDNCSEATRKGLNMNFVPRHPLDTNRRNHFDVCGIDPARYERLVELVGSSDYLIAHQL